MRPRRPARKPPEELEELEFPRVQVHHWSAGTEALTWSTCSPQPAQVVFPQLRHFTGRHMVFPFGSPACRGGWVRGAAAENTPWGIRRARFWAVACHFLRVS